VEQLAAGLEHSFSLEMRKSCTMSHFYTTEEVESMIPLLKHYSSHIEDLFMTLELTCNEIDALEPSDSSGKKIDPRKTLNYLECKFNLTEERILDIVKEVQELGMSICSPVFGVIDIPIISRKKVEAILCYEHNMSSAEDFLCHKIIKGKRRSELVRFLDL